MTVGSVLDGYRENTRSLSGANARKGVFKRDATLRVHTESRGGVQVWERVRLVVGRASTSTSSSGAYTGA